jgi:type VI secretion system secreted protein VgrG
MSEDNVIDSIAFASGAMSSRSFRLRGVHGRESISKLFEYDLLVARENNATPFTLDEIDSLLSSPCSLALGRKPSDRVHGILTDVEFVRTEPLQGALYRMRMVPSVWLLTQTRINRVYQDLNVPTLVERVLKQYGQAKGKDFDVLLSGTSPEREYIVQYDESDWDFLQRWLEHEGFFYWFEHGENAEKLIISNNHADATSIASPSTIGFRGRNNLDANVSSVWDLRMKQQRIPARVGVFDYNYRKPVTDMFVKRDVDTKRGFGSIFYYGEHFKDNDQGSAIAKARAERFLTIQRTFNGRSDCRRFRVGHSFELENHTESEFDTHYLITSLEFRVGSNVDEPGPDILVYSAEFGAVWLDVPYRPERVTPWPRIDGVMHAHIESDTSGDYAEIDNLGRYKVRLPFDGGNAKGAKASRWIRMAQPYSGAGYGSHFPLHKGTEVLLSHIDGDPDRPIIVASVPNTHTVSPSTDSNATQSVIQTHSGLRIEMEDRQG